MVAVRKSRVLPILLIVFGPLLVLVAPVAGVIGFGSMALAAFAVDFDGPTVDEQQPWLNEVPTTVTLVADAAELPSAGECSVVAPSGAAVEIVDSGLPDVSHTQDGIDYEPFAQFEAVEDGEYTVDCGASSSGVYWQSGLQEESAFMNTMFVVSAILFAVGVALLVLGIVLLVRVNRHNRTLAGQVSFGGGLSQGAGM